MPSSDDLIHIYEIPTIPITHLRAQQRTQGPQTKEESDQHLIQFEQLLSSLMYEGKPFGFRISVEEGKFRLYFLARGDAHTSSMLQHQVESHLEGFTLKKTEPPEKFSLSSGYIVLIHGVPKHSLDSLNPLCRILRTLNCSALYQVWSSAVRPSRLKRYVAKKRLESASRRSQRQDTERSLFRESETVTRIDADALLSSERLEKDYRRSRANKLLRCRVVLALWGNDVDRSSFDMALNALRGSLSREDKAESLKVHRFGGFWARKLLRNTQTLSTKTSGTDLLPREAVPYFSIPTIDLGISASSPASFSTFGGERSESDFPFKQGMIALGRLLPSFEVKYLDLEILRKHVLITGITGSGKSSTKNRIIIDAWRNGIPSLVLEPVKTDARALLGAIPELRYFTLGRETITPFRTNPFTVQPGGAIQTHIGNFYASLVAAWPMYGMLQKHVKRVLQLTYANGGWDVLRDIYGRPITMDIFHEESDTYTTEVLQYGTELSQDYKGAILSRAEDFCTPVMAAIFNTTCELPMPELFSKPTVIELEHLGDPECTAFILALILTKVIEHFKQLGPSKKLRAILVIDEAHRVLEELPKVADMSEGAMAVRMVAAQLVNLIAESRTYGLGVILSEQSISRLDRDAIKNCHTKITHLTTSGDDIDLTVREFGCNEEQRQHIRALKTGETIISDPSNITPFNVQIFHDPDRYPEMNKVWTDDDLRERMSPFFEAHPELAKTPEIPVIKRRGTLAGQRYQAQVVPLLDVLDSIVQTQAFGKLYEEALVELDADIESPMLEELLAHYIGNLWFITSDPLEATLSMYELASATYGPAPRIPNYPLVLQLFSSQTAQEEGGVSHA